MTERLQVKDVGEQGLLQRLFRFCDSEVVGDDAAVISVPEGRSLVITEDMLVDGVHFSIGMSFPGLTTTSAMDVGWRSATANLSDLAAMGATPLGITVALGLPDECPVRWLEDLYMGMVACLAPWNTPIVGGDLSRSTVLTVAIAAFGTIAPQQVIRRSAAQPGDAILVTGAHGASRAGLELLLHPEEGNGLPMSDRHLLTRAHQRPQARLDVLPHLAALNSGRIAGMDSSDGLADAIVQICRASGVGAVVERSHIPLPAPFATWPAANRGLEWALYGGEDFELVLCLPPDQALKLEQCIPHSRIIGRIVEGKEVVLRDSDHPNWVQPLSLDRGFQHFG